MKPFRVRVIRAVVMALLVLALTANVAAAREGGSILQYVVPYDPGLPGDELPPFPVWPPTD